MANVDPFVIKWPKKWIEDPELRAVLFYLNKFLHDLWLRTGGGPDFIEENDQDITALTARVAALELRMSIVELRLDLVEDRVTYLEGTTVVTAVDVAASGNQVIICTDSLTVTMALAPLDKDVVEVKATNGKVIIDGNGNTIDGSSTVTIRRDNTGLSMEYSSTADAWFII